MSALIIAIDRCGGGAKSLSVGLALATTLMVSCKSIIPRSLPAFQDINRVEAVTDYTEMLVVEDSGRVKRISEFINAHRSGWREAIYLPQAPQVNLELCNRSRYLGRFEIGEYFVNRHYEGWWWYKQIPEAEIKRFLASIDMRLVEALRPVIPANTKPAETPEYWQKKLATELPAGSSMQQIRAFIEKNGSTRYSRTQGTPTNSMLIKLRTVHSGDYIDTTHRAFLTLDDQNRLVDARLQAYELTVKKGVDPLSDPLYPCDWHPSHSGKER